MTKELLVCDSCKSDNVGVDAWADPNTNELIATFDHAHCFDCDGQTQLTRATNEKED